MTNGERAMKTYTIKPLKWRYKKHDHEWEAEMGGGAKYSACAGHKAGLFKWYYRDVFVDEETTMKEAKAAAQRHFERLVSEYLVEAQ